MNTTIEHFEADVDLDEYLAGYRDAEKFLGYCRQCGNYGRRHGCPPFDYDVAARIKRYARVRIFGVKITPDHPGLPLSAAHEMMRPVLMDMNGRLLELEKKLDGMACGFVGQCPYCDQPCARINNQPCRHPGLVRPSLEAYGFDIGLTASRLLGVELQWGHDGLMPPYLMLVCGLFYGCRHEP